MKIIFNVVILIVFGLVLFAQQPISTGLPSTAIAYFNRTTATGCPASWTELTVARGAALVGLPSGGTKGTIVGTALTDQENRHHTNIITHTHSLSAHTHTFSGVTSGPSATVNVSDIGQNHDTNTGSHAHNWSGTSGAPSSDVTGAASTANSGNESTVITPYMQLLFCKKS